ncbi:MAG TPA: glycosyl hydrolase family 28-related protein [Candidatus Acidoferrum sp.]|nr:glycosyl hydrolase family 28-related protein [Candidatus Acidoferrum sp.]
MSDATKPFRLFRLSEFYFLAIFFLLVNLRAEPAVNVYNVRDFGALGDGTNLDSVAIDRAIDSAAAAGGGTVLVPAGNYLCGSIHLRSNLHLVIDAGGNSWGAAANECL